MSQPCAKCGQAPRASNHAYCRVCRNEYQNAYRQRRYREEAEYRERIRRSARQRLYKVDPKQYADLLQGQGGVCAICGRQPQAQGPKGLNVDHCHKTGTVRGLLCGACNRGMGLLGDDAHRLRAAAAYLDLFDN